MKNYDSLLKTINDKLIELINNAQIENHEKLNISDIIQEVVDEYRSHLDNSSVKAELCDINKQEYTIPGEIGNLVELRHLYINEQFRINLPPQIGNLRKLRTLSIFCNTIKLPAEMVKLKQLQELVIGVNSIEKTFPVITCFTSLKKLSLTLCSLNYLPASIENLSNLEELIIHNNEIEELPVEIGKLVHLVTLDASHNKLSKIPNSIVKLQSLEVLNLSNNDIKKILLDIDKLHNLKVLNLASNRLTELPEKIGKLTNLENLNLGLNNITEAPNSLSNLTNLKSLSLYNNKLINGFPSAILNLLELISLDISGTNSTVIPPEIGKLAKITWLSLGYNNLDEIPKELFLIKTLETLNLDGNNLRTLPKEIGKLKNLKRLSISYNHLSDLTDALGELTNLESLDLENNYLTSLPSSIKELEKILENLYLNNNELTKLPVELTALFHIRQLELHDNPFAFPPYAIVEQGISDINDWFELFRITKRDNPKSLQVFNEGKLIIVGEKEVGKTSLREKLIHNTYTVKKPSTTGIAIEKWVINKPQNIELAIWDFGGQDIYYSTHSFFLTKWSIYILVWEAEQNPEIIKYWLTQISSYGGYNSQVFIVRNKTDKGFFKELDKFQLTREFPQLKDLFFHSVSCLNGEGIETLREEIINQALKLPLMNTIWFKSWFQLRQELEKDPRNYIEYSEYSNLCEGHGIIRRQEEILVEFQHNLGQLQFFKQDPYLANYIFLKPQWLLAAAYNILDSDVIQGSKGRIDRFALEKIWKDSASYSKKDLDVLIKIMVCFGILIEIQDEDRDFIVPANLPQNKPRFKWNSTENLRFEYQYSFLPLAFLERFIAKTGKLLVERNREVFCWRNGACITKDKIYALIERKLENKSILVRIDGKEKYKLSIIVQDVFNTIHEGIIKESWKFVIPCNCHDDCSYRYDYDYLLKQKDAEKYYIDCPKSGKTVDVSLLLYGTYAEDGRRINIATEKESTKITNIKKSDFKNIQKISVYLDKCVLTLKRAKKSREVFFTAHQCVVLLGFLCKKLKIDKKKYLENKVNRPSQIGEFADSELEEMISIALKKQTKISDCFNQLRKIFRDDLGINVKRYLIQREKDGMPCLFQLRYDKKIYFHPDFKKEYKESLMGIEKLSLTK